MRKTLFLFGIILVVGGCKFQTTRINQEKDKKEAEVITDQFHELIKKEDYQTSLNLFSDSVFSSLEKEKVLEAFIATTEKLGLLKETKLSKWETIVTSGKKSSSEYYLVYKNRHEKYEAIESINLRKERNGSIKIIGYDIKSEGFIK